MSVSVDGVTEIDATVGGVTGTVTCAAPDRLSLVAVMVALPAATPVTTPVDDTETALEFELDQDTVRPVRTLPAESLSVTVNCDVLPIDSESVAGETITAATATFAI